MPSIFIFEMLLIFVAPGIAAAVSIGSTARKVAWYAGTAALVFLADVITALVVRLTHGLNLSSNEPLVATFVMLIVNVGMIAAAASSGKKCPSCQSRIHPEATRCPKCHANLST